MAAPTRNDVARLAGTSPAVVSYVMNNGPRPVSDAARGRVLRAIEELGYRPNVTARALKTRRTQAIGLIVPDNSNPFFARLASEFEDLAFERGHVVMLGNSANSRDRERRHLESFIDRQVDGILMSVVDDATSLDVLDQAAGLRVVCVDRAPLDAWYPVISSDHRAGARLGVEHLLAHGHGAPAIIAGPPGITVAETRLAGALDALEALDGLDALDAQADARPPGQQDPDAVEVERAPFTPEGGLEAFNRLLARRGGRPPRAVFTSSDMQATGVLFGAAQAGVVIPDQMALVSFDGVEDLGYTVPPLTTVSQPIAAIARRALDALLGGDPPARAALPCELVIRESCGCQTLGGQRAGQAPTAEPSPT
ncbi:MAG: LacI family transcriptional regulator [Bifidobacteriaceae bacterium]|jgi:LacI family transcriptional regulator|nr:LacI family transcriptional regulator [Bifidobacteriaceae bacterium]